MKLFLVHCGFYPEASQGIFEAHQDLFVVAEDWEAARTNAKALPLFKTNRMHIDGIIEVEAVDGYRLGLQLDEGLKGESRLVTKRHRDLASGSTNLSVATTSLGGQS